MRYVAAPLPDRKAAACPAGPQHWSMEQAAPMAADASGRIVLFLARCESCGTALVSVPSAGDAGRWRTYEVVVEEEP